MANSLRDQLLKAGLVTEEQIEKATSNKKKKPHQKRTNHPKSKKVAPKTNQNKKSESSDLAQFYQQRAQLERKEKQEENRRKQEAAKLKKERRQKIGKLIKEHALDTEAGDIRYNFVVGTNIKYLFVTKQQQQQLAEGELAITFLGGKKCLIPVETGKQIIAIDPDKIVILPK